MKKDIIFPKVEGVSVAIARKKNDISTDFDWHVYLINKNPFPITGVLITSKGYGFNGEEQQRTSTLHQLIMEIGSNSHAVIERIDPSVFHLTSEYWVSYYVDGDIYDKRFIFVPDSIIEENLRPIGELDLEGILHE
jgi:hypothetical protein